MLARTAPLIGRIRRALPGLDQLPSIAGRISKAGIHAAESSNWLLGEFNAGGVEPVVRSTAVTDDQNERWHGAFCDDLVDGSGGGLIDRWRLRPE